MSIPNIVYKAHATGNDFVVYVDPEGAYEPTADEVRMLCERHFGIGGDGLIRLAHPKDVSDLNDAQVDECAAGDAQWFMDYRNADGSLAEMCGNGTRAITLFAQRQGIADQPGGKPFRLGTRAGVKVLTSLGNVPGLGNDVFQVEMGAWKRGELDFYEVTIPGTKGSARGTFVDMGNPHGVAVIEDAFSSLPTVEQLDLVTKRSFRPRSKATRTLNSCVSTNKAKATTKGSATMRVNERGCGETLSCGTGLCRHRHHPVHQNRYRPLDDHRTWRHLARRRDRR